jgi:hypothetical protein
MERRWRGAARPWLVAAALPLGLAAPLAQGGQELVPVGGELQVNGYTTSYQINPALSAAADGDFVVVWTSYGSDESDTSYGSIQGQRYASDGSPQGMQFQVNSSTDDAQRFPAVAAADNGDFVVVWESYTSGGDDDSDRSVQGQRFASDGTTLGGEFQVNTYTTLGQMLPRVATASDGDFVVVWTSYGSYGSDTSSYSVQGQRYASDGSAQGGQFQVNAYTSLVQAFASVAASDDGDFVVVWQGFGGYGTDTSLFGIHGQRFASDGSAQGGEFQVNTYTPGFQQIPAVAVTAEGGFAVVWQSGGSNGSDTSGESVQGQRYASDGSAQGGEFQVNADTTGAQVYPSVAAEPGGGFVVAWQSDVSSGTDASGESVQAQHYAADGTAQGAQFQVNTYTPMVQGYPSVASGAGGEFVVAWSSYGSADSDGDAESVQAQRYAVSAAVPSLSPAGAAAGALLLLLAAASALRRRA